MNKADNEGRLLQLAIDEANRPKEIEREWGKLNGKWLEIWYAKMLINFAVAEKFKVKINFKEVLPMLYQGKPFPEPFGLYLSYPEIKKEGHDIFIEHWGFNGELIGGFISIMGNVFFMMLPNSQVLRAIMRVLGPFWRRWVARSSSCAVRKIIGFGV